MGVRTILVTGGCGFIGSNFIRHIAQVRPEWRIVNVDALTYAGNLNNLKGVEGLCDYRFVKGDIRDFGVVKSIFEDLGHPADYVVNFAAESHVDRSILNPSAFIDTNIHGVFHLLEMLRASKVERFLQVSTDEVYGYLGDEGTFTESTPLAPSSPYSASKASADLLIQAYRHTYGLDTVITRCSNNYGPYQFPEKLIPLMILNAKQGKELPVYGTGMNVRDWIHVLDHCRGILAALERGKGGEVYNFGGRTELPNLAIVQRIADTVAGGRECIRFVKDRPGHDWRYAMNPAKAEHELGWKAEIAFEDGLNDTIHWYLNHEDWWQPILTGEYMTYYETWYGNR